MSRDGGRPIGTLCQTYDPRDAVRHIGTLAAHPIKNQDTGEVMDEPGEAEGFQARPRFR